MKRGFGFIEMILVVAVIISLGVLVIPFAGTFVLTNNFEMTANEVVGKIRKAQSYALDGKDGQTWGVCLSGRTLRLFSGSCTTPVFSETSTVPDNVSVAGLTETTFSKFRGEPSAPLSVTIQTTQSSKTISVNRAGGIEVN